ncbi:hypothetical protein [Nocardia vaccinii]|uniref:hypothetical protein n=1 Tax=Nocardia vaccinii TaxID=1822 RepID=UPI0012F47BCE|nr:hypothetical protein [Nocardia vaccinii]
MLRFAPEGELPRRVPAASRVRFAICPDVRDLAEVDEPTTDLLLRVRDALRTWVSTDTSVG